MSVDSSIRRSTNSTYYTRRPRVYLLPYVIALFDFVECSLNTFLFTGLFTANEGFQLASFRAVF
jgi:hypothetical protein